MLDSGLRYIQETRVFNNAHYPSSPIRKLIKSILSSRSIFHNLLQISDYFGIGVGSKMKNTL